MINTSPTNMGKFSQKFFPEFFCEYITKGIIPPFYPVNMSFRGGGIRRGEGYPHSRGYIGEDIPYTVDSKDP